MTRTPVPRRTPFLLAAVMAVLLTVLPAPLAGAAHTLATPTGVTATAADGAVELSWGAVPDADGYQIEHGVQLSGTTTTATTTATTRTFSGLTNGQFYVFRVQATDSTSTHPAGAYSGWVTAMPLAQVSSTLVSNLGQTSAAGSWTTTTGSVSQAFTTGANTTGYVLSGIDVDVKTALNATAAARVRAELWSADAQGDPGVFLEALDVPETLSVGSNALTAPAGTVLAPETTYHVAFFTSTNSQSFVKSITASQAEDSGAAVGWSIGDGVHRTAAGSPHSLGSNTWSVTSSHNFKIAVKGAARTPGTGRPIWSATLNAASVAGNFGCFGHSDGGGVSCGNAAILSNHDFAYEGSELLVSQVEHVNSGTDSSRQLSFQIRTAIDDAAFKELTLHVGNNSFAVTDATVTHETTNTGLENYSQAVWTSTGMTWAASDQIRVVLTVSEVSSNADLSGLSAASDTSSSGQFGSSLTLSPAFAADTLSYTASVGNEMTHAKLTATVADTGKASVKVGKTGNLADATSGTASAAIGLDVGANAILVEVTAQDGTTMKTYTVTITRAGAGAVRSSDNDLSALVVKAHTSSTGTFAGQALSPAFAAGTSSYRVTVGNEMTHARLTATVADAGKATVAIGKGASLTAATSGTESDAIALDVGANAVTVRVTAEDATTKDYTVTIDRESPRAAGTVSGVRAAAHHEALVVSWTPPAGAVSSYDVEFKERSAPDAPADPPSEVSTGWVVSGSARSPQLVDGLVNGTVYDVRVRHRTAADAVGRWVSARGTPRPYRLTLSASPRSVAEGSSATLTASLDRQLASGTIEVSFYDDAERSTVSVGEYTFTASGHTTTGASRGVSIPTGGRTATATLNVLTDDDREPAETLHINASTTPFTAVSTITPVTVTVPGDPGAPPPPGGGGPVAPPPGGGGPVAPPPGGSGAPPSGGSPDAAVGDPEGVTRLAGSDRYATARAVAQQIASGNDGTLDAVVIVGGHSTADAVIAASLAGALDAAVLLAGPDGLSDADIELLTRTKASSVIAVGDAEHVSDEALAALEGIDPDPERITGADPYETSAAVAQRVGAPARLGPTLGRTVVVARGETFADGLVAGPFAAAGPHPILLAGPDGLHPDALSYLAQHADTVVIIGGLQAVPQTVQDTITSLERRPAADTAIRIIRIGGDTRYDTARRFAQFVLGPQVAPHRCTRPERAGLAVGTTPADAAVAAPLLAKRCAPVLLTRSERMPDTTRAHLRGVTELWVIGGHTAIPPATLRPR